MNIIILPMFCFFLADFAYNNPKSNSAIFILRIFLAWFDKNIYLFELAKLDNTLHCFVIIDIFMNG